MADVGNTAQGASSDNGEARARGIPITMPEAGDITAITAWINETSGAGSHNFAAAIYDTSGNLLAQSAVRNDITTTNAAEVFPITYSASASEELIIAIGCGSGGGSVILRYETVADINKEETLANVADVTWPNPVTWDDTNTLGYSIFATYTPSGGGGAAPKTSKRTLMGVG